jgi:glycosyltransferase involved in cell wall biosynthesis
MTKILRIITRLNIGGPALHVTNLNYYLDKEYGYESVLVYGSLAEGEGSMEYLAKNKKLKTIIFPELGREISPLNDLKIIWKLFWLIKKEKPDIVHTHTAKAGLSGRIAAKLAGVKKIYHTFHGNVFNGYFSGLKTKLFILIERFCAFFSTKIIAISEEQKKDLIKYRIAPLSKITVIPLGFELERFKVEPHKKYLRKQLGLPDDLKLIGIVGRLVPIKNHAYYIDIAEKVLKKIDNVRFLLIGDGDLKDELLKLIAAKGLQQKIFITGFINEVEKIYSDLDIVALTSKNEGTPVTLIEALACAKPVISTDVGGVRDILQHGKYGWLETLDNPEKYANDLIAMLMNYPAALEKAKLGQKFILANYDVKVLYKNINSLYSGCSSAVI